jgi:signal peptidase II
MQAARGASLTEGATDASGGAVVDTPPRARRTLRLALVAVAVLLADLISKVIVVATLEDKDLPPVELFGGLVYLIHTRNPGAAFSLGTGYTVVLTVIAIGVIGFILHIARRLQSAGWAVALGLVLGGAAGNLVDRLFRTPGPMRGHVVDFVALWDPSDPVWPVFNVADCALVVGVSLAVLLELRGYRIDGRRVRKADGG